MKIRNTVSAVLAKDEEMRALPDSSLRALALNLRAEAKSGAAPESLLVPAFALVREAARRVTGKSLYPVQIAGGIRLHEGRIAEMKTGEGKSLACAAPAFLNALSGRSVMIVTVNDYLAARDAEAVGDIHRSLGLTVGCVLHAHNHEERKSAYASDITYVTNNELGFDYLRDGLVKRPEDRVLRGLDYAIVDEADSVLIDEAKTPLIISGPREGTAEAYAGPDRFVKQLERGALDEKAGSEAGDYIADEKERSVALTAEGVRKAEEFFHISNLSDPENMPLFHHIQAALRANALMRRNRDYVVKDGAILIVDEFTGRVLPGRRFSDGLHQALEAKEGVHVQDESITLSSITFQNFFRQFGKLAGMTGTAWTSRRELWDVYRLKVSRIPPNRPVIRIDHADTLFPTAADRDAAVIRKMQVLHAAGRPILVGTSSVSQSEALSRKCVDAGIPHVVLNAKNDAKEAEIVAMAGRAGAVTIATNMAGRGTDIVLDDEAKRLGGLYVIGTARHESRRVDDQLAGRAGRQGDPGETEFLLSLDDPLFKICRLDGLRGALDPDGSTGRIITRAVCRAQKRVELLRLGERMDLLKYDDIDGRNRKTMADMRNRMLAEPATEEYFLRIAEAARAGRGGNAPGETEDGIRARSKDMAWLKVSKSLALQAVDHAWQKYLDEAAHLRDSSGFAAYGSDPAVWYREAAAGLYKRLMQEAREQVLKEIMQIRIIRIAA